MWGCLRRSMLLRGVRMSFSPWSFRTLCVSLSCFFFFFFQAEDGIRDFHVTGVQTCALPISLGARRLALNRTVLEPGSESAPPHCHAAIEETFVVLDGDGVVEVGEEAHELRAGSIVVRPAGTGVAHVFRAGEQGMTFLAFSDKAPGDMVFSPRSGKLPL